VTSKTSPKITSALERTLAELREGDRRRDSLVSAYFQRGADLAAAENQVDRVRQAGQAQIAKVTVAVEERVTAAVRGGEPARAALARALVSVADDLGDTATAESLGVSLKQIRAARKRAPSTAEPASPSGPPAILPESRGGSHARNDAHCCTDRAGNAELASRCVTRP
jgi:hypothetical protein